MKRKGAIFFNKLKRVRYSNSMWGNKQVKKMTSKTGTALAKSDSQELPVEALTIP